MCILVIKQAKIDKNSMLSSLYIRDLNLPPIRFVQFVPQFVLRCRLYSFIISMRRAIEWFRVVIEGKKRERDYWGANSSPGCSLIHGPRQKSRFRRVFLLFEMFFLVKILKISSQIVSNNKNNLKSTILPTKPAERPQQRWGKHFIQISAVAKEVAKEASGPASGNWICLL